MPGYSSEKLNLALAEYLGNFPSDVVCHHGNSKNTKQEYIRTSPAMKKQTLNEIKSGKSVKNIFSSAFTSEQHQPRDSKFVENMKFNMNKKENPGNRKNTADDLQTLISLESDGNSFIKEIIHSGAKPPNVICYTDFQIRHLKNSLHSSVIGIDQTFNLGACFVTTTVFQEKKLLRKGTSTNPIILGPVYLHWDGSFHTYQRFFSHLLAVLGLKDETQISANELILGTDEEKALIKAKKNSFPNSKTTLCTRHLGENFKRYVKNKIGMCEKETNMIFNKIFGCGGLVEQDTTIDFDSQATEIVRNYSHLGPYLTDKIIPSIREYIYNVRSSDSKVPPNWKNNNCESINHILKLNQNWTPQKLPELVEKIHQECKLQEALVKGALYGHGDFELHPFLSKLRCGKIIWQSKTDHEKESLVSKFFNFGLKNIPEKFIVSSDGRLKIPKVPEIAKKPGQRKRVRPNKTNSVLKKVRLE